MRSACLRAVCLPEVLLGPRASPPPITPLAPPPLRPRARRPPAPPACVPAGRRPRVLPRWLRLRRARVAAGHAGPARAHCAQRHHDARHCAARLRVRLQPGGRHPQGLGAGLQGTLLPQQVRLRPGWGGGQGQGARRKGWAWCCRRGGRGGGRFGGWDRGEARLAGARALWSCRLHTTLTSRAP